MRYVLAAALAVFVANPAAAQDTWAPRDSREFSAFLVAMFGSGIRVANWDAAFRLHRCNIIESKKLAAERTGIALIGVFVEAEAAMAACAAEVDQLAKTLPANEVTAIKAAIMLGNLKVIEETRNPPTTTCAVDVDETSGLCSRR